jgi:hypothetical protein
MITDDHVSLFGRLFSGRRDVYGTYDPATKQAWQVKAPVTRRVVMDHLLGRRPYGVYLLQGDSVAAAAVDFDQEDTRAPAEFVRRMAAVGIAAYIERSKSKGYHVWVFLVPEAVKARIFRALARGVLIQMGCAAVEVFPKQDAITSPTFYGNFINAPLFGPLVEQGRTVFVDENFTPFQDQWDFLAGVRRVTASELDAACSKMGCHAAPAVPVVSSPSSSTRPAAGSFALMPCAQRMLTEGVKENQRAACFRLAAQLRKAGIPYEYAVLILTKWAEKNHPSEGKAIISFGEIGSQTRAAYRDHLYLACGCDDESVIPFCTTTCPIRRRRDKEAEVTPPPPATQQGGVRREG